MEHSTSLESQLAQWKPRPPSVKLHRKLARAVVLDEKPAATNEEFVVRWLSPVLACFLFALLAVHPTNPNFRNFAITGTNILFPSITTQSNGKNTAPEIGHSQQNSLPKAKLERNFGGQSVEQQRLFSLVTNNLRQ